MEATTADRAPSGGSPVANRPDRYFDITARGSSIPTEVRGGAATFLTMAYILFVNPQILGSVAAPGGVKLPFDQLLTVTALVAPPSRWASMAATRSRSPPGWASTPSWPSRSWAPTA